MLKRLSNWVSEKRNRFLKSHLENPLRPITGATLDGTLTVESSAGIDIGYANIMTYSPIWGAVKVVSEDVSRIPWCVYQVDSDGNREMVSPSHHPVAHLLECETSPPGTPDHMTVNQFIQRMIGHSMLHGSAYARIFKDERGRANKLEWLHSSRVQVHRFNGVREFHVIYNGMHDAPNPINRAGQTGQTEILFEDQVFVLDGLTLDEKWGLSIVQFARNSVGRAVAAEQYNDDFFRNHGIPSGFFEHPGEMSDDAIRKFMRRMAAMHGRGNRHKFGLLEEGMGFKNTGTSPKDAMMIEALQWGVKDVARFTGVPLHKLADDARTGYNTTEAENQAFVDSTLGSWMTKLCKEANAKLFSRSGPNVTPDDNRQPMATRPREPVPTGRQVRYITEFDIDRYVRANTKDRFDGYSVAVQNGIMTPNEARQRENLNPLPGGDELWRPLNMATVTQHDEMLVKDEPEPEPEEQPVNEEPQEDEQPPQDNRSLLAAHDVAHDALLRMSKRISKAADRAARKPNEFLAFVNNLESDHESIIRDGLRPILGLAQSLGGNGDDPTGKLIEEARELLLTACECQPEELEQQVARAGNALCNGITSNLAKGLFDENNASV